MSMDLDEIALLSKAKRHEPEAQRLVVDIIGRSWMPGLLRKIIRGAGRPGWERADIEQEFWLGVQEGIQDVNLSLGNPLAYVVQRGKWKVLGAQDLLFRQSLVYRCSTCATPWSSAFLASSLKLSQGRWVMERVSRRRCNQCGNLLETALSVVTSPVGEILDLADIRHNNAEQIEEEEFEQVARQRILRIFKGKRRHVLEMLLQDGLQAMEIAKRLGMPHAGIYKHLKHIRDKMPRPVVKRLIRDLEKSHV